MRYVLASASPRRRELLSRLCAHFEVCVSGVDEDAFAHDDPARRVEALALAKARAAFAALGSPAQTLVIGADTVVALEAELLEKPRDEADAARMLRLLSGRSHHVLTGAALVGEDGESCFHESTLVFFAALSEAEIAGYIATGEPLDKAGAYGIQGAAAPFVTRIEGDYFNVMGLPLAALYAQLMRRVPDFSPFEP